MNGTDVKNGFAEMEKPMQDIFLDQVESFLLGSLEQHEADQFVQHVAAGCAACQQALGEAKRVLHALPFALSSSEASPFALVAPPASLKERLLRSLKSSSNDEPNPQIWKTWSDSSKTSSLAAPGLLIVRADQDEWEDIGVNGIQVKRLYVDTAHDSVTMLVKAPAGAVYPRHRHAGPEQCYVLQGDLHMAGTVLRAGDYQYAEPESIHGLQYTENGCMLLIVSSLHDEMLAGEAE